MIHFQRIANIISLIDVVTSEKGKKQASKNQKETDKKSLRNKFDTILDKIASEIEALESYKTDISLQMENFVQQSFEKHMAKKKKIYYDIPETYDRLLTGYIDFQKSPIISGNNLLTFINSTFLSVQVIVF